MTWWWRPARPVSAEFRYELEDREGGLTGKLTLPGVDRWPPADGTGTRFRQEGSRLIFTLPLSSLLLAVTYHALNEAAPAPVPRDPATWEEGQS